MTIDLLNKIYESWINKNEINEFCSEEVLLWSDESKTDEQREWLRRFIDIWDKVEEK